MYNVKVRYFSNGDMQIRFYREPILPVDLEFNYATGELYERKRSDGKIEEWNPFTEEWEIMTVIDEDKAKESLRISGNRSKACVYDIARSNRWDWFLTFTFSPDKVDRESYSACSGKLKQWLDYMRRKNPGMKYLVVPEEHKKGGWHFHGLFADCPELTFQESGHRDSSGRQIYNLLDYNLGFTTATRVSDSRKAAGYLTKYITKSLTSQTAGKKRYWASRNCARPAEETYCIPGNYMVKMQELGIDADYIKRVGTPTGNVVTYIEVNKSPEDFSELCARHDVFLGKEHISEN